VDDLQPPVRRPVLLVGSLTLQDNYGRVGYLTRNDDEIFPQARSVSTRGTSRRSSAPTCSRTTWGSASSSDPQAA
jgi:hypothetical protein